MVWKIVRESDVKSTPEIIWKSCFANMQFDKWDPDTAPLEDVNGGCENGTTFNYVMKCDSSWSPMKYIPSRLADVKENRTVRYIGTAANGILEYDGFIEISPNKKAPHTSHIKYTVTMHGLPGAVMSLIKKEQLIESVEVGLRNIVQISEDARRQELKAYIRKVVHGSNDRSSNNKKVVHVSDTTSDEEVRRRDLKLYIRKVATNSDSGTRQEQQIIRNPAA